jgi:hypothetical protein
MSKEHLPYSRSRLITKTKVTSQMSNCIKLGETERNLVFASEALGPLSLGKKERERGKEERRKGKGRKEGGKERMRKERKKEGSHLIFLWPSFLSLKQK